MVRDLTAIIPDMFTYWINSLLIIKPIRLLPPPPRHVHPPPPHPVPPGQAPGAGSSLLTRALTACPVSPLRSAWMLIPETHSSTSHPLFPPLESWSQTSLPHVDRPPDLHKQPFRWTRSSLGSGACALIHAVKQAEKLRKKDHQAACALFKGLGKKRKNSWEWPSCLKAIVTLPFCPGYWRLSSRVNWNVMNRSDHSQPVQCVRGTSIVFGTISCKNKPRLRISYFFIKFLLGSGTHKKH